jgi:hypothetical protein
MKRGHIAAVELLPGLNDEEAAEKSRELFEARKNEAGYEGFEVWELARMVLQYPAAEAEAPSAISQNSPNSKRKPFRRNS